MIAVVIVLVCGSCAVMWASVAGARAPITFDKALSKAEHATANAPVFVLQAHKPKSLPATFFEDRKTEHFEHVIRSGKWGTIQWQFRNRAYLRITGTRFPARDRGCYFVANKSWRQATKKYSLTQLLNGLGVMPSRAGGRRELAGRTLIEKDFIRSLTAPGRKPQPPTLSSVQKITVGKASRIKRGYSWWMGGQVTTADVSYPRTLPPSVKRPTGAVCK